MDFDINPLFIFYVTLGGNFVAQLFPCQVQKLFTENIYYKHFLAFFILIFGELLKLKLKKNHTYFILKVYWTMG